MNSGAQIVAELSLVASVTSWLALVIVSGLTLAACGGAAFFLGLTSRQRKRALNRARQVLGGR